MSDSTWDSENDIHSWGEAESEQGTIDAEEDVLMDYEDNLGSDGSSEDAPTETQEDSHFAADDSDFAADAGPTEI